MKELTLLIEIEYAAKIEATPTAYQAGVWRYSFYTTGTVLPFMEDTFNRVPVHVNSIIIDNEEYTRFDTLDEMWEKLAYDRGGWVNGGEVIYVCCPNRRPPDVFEQRSYGVLEGYTDGRPLIRNGVMYRPGLLNAPKITHSADAFTYDRMKFNTATVTVENTKGNFDDAGKYFGNEFNLLVGTVPEEEDGQPEHLIRRIEESDGEKAVAVGGNTDEYVTVIRDKEREEPRFKMLAQYYIENISVGLGKADFKLSDKRERLSAKIPSRQYTNDPQLAGDHGYGYYPDIDDCYVGKDIQEAYGRCFGVPGVCLEGKRIVDQYRFRFSGKINRIDRVEVKMTAGEIPDTTNPGQMMRIDGWTEIWNKESGWKNGVNSTASPAGNINAYLDDGEITLRWDIAKEGGKRENRINEVRIDGVFVSFDKFPNGTPRATPLDIMKDIMYRYSGVPYDDLRYNTGEIEELKLLNDFEIGVLFDKSISVYEAIEQLQSGSVLGFQFQVHKNLFTARLDNPNREERPAISHLEIKNLHEVVVDWNAGLYGTIINIGYAKNYSEDDLSKNHINKKGRSDILSLHRVEKEWIAETLLANEKDAVLKARILVEDFSELRPIIKNIKLSGEKWLGLNEEYGELRIYDIMYIDFCIPGEEIDKYPQHIIRLISEVGEENEKVIGIGGTTDEYVIMNDDEKETPGRRPFVNRLRCQILRIEPDTTKGDTIIDVRVTGVSKAWTER